MDRSENNMALVLKQYSPHERTITVSGPTHIGRGNGKTWHVKERPSHPLFKLLDLEVRVMDERISRNHAAIVPNEKGTYSLVDLRSVNGTMINGYKVYESEHEIKIGDVISFANVLRWECTQLTPQDNRHALFIGDTGGNLVGVRQDLERLAAELSKRGFMGNISQLYGAEDGRITKKRVFDELDRLAGLTSKHSKVMVYFSGHGSPQGLEVGGQTITPDELYTALDNVRGKKAVVFDSCHSGVFLDKKYQMYLPGNILVLAAASKEGYAFETPNTLAGGKYMGLFTSALVECLRQNRSRFDLNEIGKAIAKKFTDSPIDFKYQVPEVSGTGWTVLTAYTQILGK